MGKRRRSGRLQLTALFYILGTTVAIAACDPAKVELRGAFGQAQFNVEVADEPKEREIGLMNRTDMPKSAGMLFVYERPGTVSFWMRNTFIPLDMIFTNAEGRVEYVHSNARPLDETPIFGGDNILTVLEINGGMARQIGIAKGDELRHPLIPQDQAVWPCDEFE